MPSALNTSEPVAPRSTTPASDLAADAEAVFAAVSRLQAAARTDRETLTRLRATIDSMADAVAKAKADLFAAASAEQQPDIPALLDQLEHQVDALLEIASGGAQEQPPALQGETAVPAAETVQAELEAVATETAEAASEAAQPFASEETPPSPIEPQPQEPVTAAITPVEPDQVPTVSAVVSGLSGDEPVGELGPDPAAAPDDRLARVARLKAMVEALNASVRAPLANEPIAPAAEAPPPPVEQAFASPTPPFAAAEAIPEEPPFQPGAAVALPAAVAEVVTQPEAEQVVVEAVAADLELNAADAATTPDTHAEYDSEAPSPSFDPGPAEPPLEPVDTARTPDMHAQAQPEKLSLPEFITAVEPLAREPDAEASLETQTEAELQSPQPQDELQAPQAETAVAMEQAQAPSEPEPSSPAEPAALAEPMSQAEPASPQASIAMSDLLASYEQMETWAIPPPDEGTAVIFPPRVEFVTEPPAARPQPLPPVAEPQPVTPAEPPAAAEIVPAEADASQDVAILPPEPVALETVLESLETAIAKPAEPAVAAAPPPAAELPPSAEAPAARPADTEFDPDDFLFGPEPDPDPAAFLLEPSSGTASASKEMAETTTGQTVERPQEQVKPPAADPLAPLNAMSEAERIAIFS